MKRWLASLTLVIALTLCLTGSTLADSANVTTAASWCFSLTHSTHAIIEPLVECFTDTTQGILPTVTTDFLNNARAFYLPSVGVMLVLAVAFFGIKVYTGQIERLSGDTMILALKMAGIMLFLNSAPAIYIAMVTIMQQLSETMASTATAYRWNGFCVSNILYSGGTPGDNSAWQVSLWQSWDCIFKYLLGFSNAGFATTGIAAFLFMLLQSMGTALIVFAAGLYLIVRLLTTAFKFIHVYLMSVLALSFIFCLGYLLVPLLLFKSTMRYFTKWLSMVFGFMLTPVMMFSFMGMLLVALDISIFTGPYSVYCQIGGASYCGTNSAAGLNLFKNITSVVIPYDTVDNSPTTGNPYLLDNFTRGFDFGFNGPSSLDLVDNGGLSSAAFLTPQGTGAGGIQAQQLYFPGAPVMGADYNATVHPETVPAGIDSVRLNMSLLASEAGSSCVLSALGSGVGSGSNPSFYYSDCPWLQNIAVSLCVALLITYIMGSLLEYIPQLASNITTRLNDSVANQGLAVAQSKVFGEDAAKSISGKIMQAGKNLNSGRGNDSTLSSRR